MGYDLLMTSLIYGLVSCKSLTFGFQLNSFCNDIRRNQLMISFHAFFQVTTIFTTLMVHLVNKIIIHASGLSEYMFLLTMFFFHFELILAISILYVRLFCDIFILYQTKKITKYFQKILPSFYLQEILLYFSSIYSAINIAIKATRADTRLDYFFHYFYYTQNIFKPFSLIFFDIYFHFDNISLVSINFILDCYQIQDSLLKKKVQFFFF